MKHSAVVAFLFAAVTVTAPAFAQEEGGQRRAPSPVKAQMEKLEEALEAVGKFLEKPEGDAPMAQVVAAAAAVHEAKQHEPRSTQGQPEEKRGDYVKQYRMELNKVLRGILDLEDALLGADWTAAKKAVEELEKLEKSGHQTFKPRRRRGGQGGQGGGERGGD